MTVAEFIFSFLESKKIDTVYMVSGSSAMWLTDALYKSKGLQAVCTHHEQVAAMAADLYGRTRGIPGVALVTIGPGATNAITGVAEAFLDSSPLFIISGQANSRLIRYEQETHIRQHGTQSLDLEPLVSSITKYFAVIMEPEDIKYHMERAWYEAMKGRRGPVWIDVPVDVQNKSVPNDMNTYLTEDTVKNIQLTDNVIPEEIFTKLKKAKKPLILAGGGITYTVLAKIVTALEIPVVTSRMGIDRIESDSIYYVGRIGAYGQRAAHFAVQQADFLLILGSRLSVSSIGYYPDKFGIQAYKVQVDIDDKELKKTDVPIDIKLHMTTEEFAEKIIDVGCLERKEWISYCRNLRKRYPIVIEDYRNSDPFNSYYFTELLSQYAPNNATIVVDTGSVCNVVSQTWNIKKGQKFLVSGGFSCMGFWAGALGCCEKNVNVIALSGDGSVSMNIQEFATLKHNGLPIKLFVYNNNGYMLIKHNQHNYMNDRFLGVSPESGVQTPDFCKVAEAYGLRHIRISYGDDVEKKILETLSAREPVVCEVIMEQFGPLAPRIASKVMPDGSLKAAEFDDLAPFLTDDEKPEMYNESNY